MAVSLVFFSTSPIAIPLFQALLKDEQFTVKGLVCQPDRPVGRGQQILPPEIKTIALAKGIPVFQPEKLKMDEQLLNYFQADAPDFFLTFAYGQILSPAWLAVPKIAPLNVHPSLLPSHRGPTPIPATLLSGDAETGITLMKMVPEMDAGPIGSQYRFSVDPLWTSGVLFDIVAEKVAEWIPDEVLRLAQNPQFTPQDDAGATYCSLLNKEDGFLDFLCSAEDLLRRYRAYTPWPGVWTRYKGQRLKLFDLSRGPVLALEPGALRLVSEGLIVGTQDGTVLVGALQMEGKKALSASVFLEGQRDFLKNLLPS